MITTFKTYNKQEKQGMQVLMNEVEQLRNLPLDTFNETTHGYRVYAEKTPTIVFEWVATRNSPFEGSIQFRAEVRNLANDKPIFQTIFYRSE